MPAASRGDHSIKCIGVFEKPCVHGKDTVFNIPADKYEWYLQMEHMHVPVRCPECSAEKKKMFAAQMAAFQNDEIGVSASCMAAVDTMQKGPAMYHDY
jgi:hypothetical protein